MIYHETRLGSLASVVKHPTSQESPELDAQNICTAMNRNSHDHAYGN